MGSCSPGSLQLAAVRHGGEDVGEGAAEEGSARLDCAAVAQRVVDAPPREPIYEALPAAARGRHEDRARGAGHEQLGRKPFARHRPAPCMCRKRRILPWPRAALHVTHAIGALLAKAVGTLEDAERSPGRLAVGRLSAGHRRWARARPRLKDVRAGAPVLRAVCGSLSRATAQVGGYLGHHPR